MYKIKTTCNWSSSQEVIQRLVTQFKLSDFHTKNIEFVTDGDYDINLVFGYITESLNNKPTLLFPQEPYWSGSHQKTFENIKNIKVFGFDKNYYNPKDIVEETVAHMFYGGRGPWEEGFDNWNYDNLISNPFHKTKNFCSFVSNRGLGETDFPKYCLYKDRLNLVQNLSSKLPFIDFYGWGESKNLLPFAKQKYSTIKDYKFCLTIENSREKNYISEKFYDCILTNTIPIYYGCSNIKDYWPENSYFLLESITDYDYLLATLNYINKNCDTLYKQMLPDILKMKIKYFNDFNLITKIINSIY
jgi:hypothetical protein